MSTNLSLEAIAGVLREVKGWFTFSTPEGEYVVIKQADFAALRAAANEQQLALPVTPTQKLSDYSGVDEENSEPDVAIWLPELDVDSSAAIADEVDDLGFGDSHESFEAERLLGARDRAGIKVRFEPLRGDLHPDLQE